MIEIRQILQDLGMEILSMKEAGIAIDIVEDGKSFEENAMIKASEIAELPEVKAMDAIVLADDSGLEVDALNGEPGVYSARYGPGHNASDAARYNYLLEKMENIEDRSARFVCCICCTMPNGDIIRARGECEGYIMRAPHGEGGFGYDPVFHPLCTDKGMAELTPEEKNEISHRGKALREFIKKLDEYMKAAE